MYPTNNGWVKLHRKILEWEWYQDGNTIRLFLHCLLKANIETKKWQGHLIERGSFITSLKHLATDLNLSTMQIRTSIKKLISTHEITHEITHSFTVISVCNYDSYQSSFLLDNTLNNTQDNNQITNEQQTDNKPITTTKEYKNNKEIKEVKKEEIRPQNLEIVISYFKEQSYPISEAEKFWNYYEANGWKVGKNPMKKWKNAAGGWISRSNNFPQSTKNSFIDKYAEQTSQYRYKEDENDPSAIYRNELLELKNNV